ncbi:MAG: transcriptional regulator NrdR [Candidatus Burarchaeum sp.]|nr:transcriptional regulator NrdR [Candidatus Burarchaeum sp.]MDO8339610.1 transcriptional regulator NrdR [Candidatus Burarchaeum sp.]
MRCPYCGHLETKVIDSRDAEDVEVTRRRRECEKCEKRFTSYERVEMVDLYVKKKDGKREPFSREKLLGGIAFACVKCNVSHEQMEAAVDDIERQLRQREDTEVPSSLIGDLVMKKLKTIDKVAYIRFASVYREFADLEDFQEELKKLLKK